LISKEYILADAGSLCSDKSFESIKDIDQCRKSFPTIKTLYPDAIDGISYPHSWSQRPRGCFFHLVNKNVHWNPHQTGSRNYDDRQVCLGKEEVEVVGNQCHSLRPYLKRYIL
jgi:hypothetical protein